MIRDIKKFWQAYENGKQYAKNIIDGNRIYYNFIRPHMALNGLTPAEVANINLELGQNRWESLIRQSSKHKKEATS